MEGAFNPQQIFQFVDALGMDLFDSSYATWLAERGQGLRLHNDYPRRDAPAYEVLDFKDNKRCELSLLGALITR